MKTLSPQRLSRRHLLTRVVPGVAAGLLVMSDPAEAATLNVDLDTQRYEDLTAAELVSMTVGIPLNNTNPHQAVRIITLSLDLEHLIAVVNIDPRKVPKEQIARIKLFQSQLENLSGVKVQLHILGDFGEETLPAVEEPKPKTRGAYRGGPTGHATRFGS